MFFEGEKFVDMYSGVLLFAAFLICKSDYFSNIVVLFV